MIVYQETHGDCYKSEQQLRISVIKNRNAKGVTSQRKVKITPLKQKFRVFLKRLGFEVKKQKRI